MTNRRLYEIMDQLGMIESKEDCCDSKMSPAEYFEKYTSRILLNTLNFVDTLTTYNDLETIKKLLVIIITENNRRN